ncbi:dihydropteroate synthase [Natronosalvus halobius]|uniref:dihydropteroate synthase n=1 Tax=Natronosalvus halobius TaxID=2953746 RepID=UPI0020A10A92|nr:dihydropteroate synthase [Natronosalvus halobius]USZ72094.1 dihydropteroate synthase [Natronosalvus halobius]
MEYHEAADLLVGLRRFRPSPGTESTRAFLEHLEDPHEGVSFVQVAGSNGKGSTSRMLESVLREAGLTVGLFTSPHLEDLRERVRVDGRKIPKAAVGEFGERTGEYLTAQAAAGASPTFFEAMTTLACWHFGRKDVDVAVLEVGIGGRYDATSVVDPVASAVTSVSLEHTGIIGDTIEEIAADKAQVAPADAPLVTATTGTALETVRSVAGEVVTVGTVEGGPLEAEGEPADRPDVTVRYGGRTNHAEAAVSIDGDGWTVDARLPVLGAHQAENAGIAAVLARQVADVSTRDVERGLRNAHWPGRFEVMGTDPLVVLDGAHNPGACERLAETLASFEYDDLQLVFGAMHDKDHREMAAALPTPDQVTACEPSLERAEDADVLARVFANAGAPSVDTEVAVLDALNAALEAAEPDDCVLVTGSLFAVAEARRRWTRTAVPKRVRDRSDARDVLEAADVDEATITDVTESGVHRVVTMALPRDGASTIERELVRVGGECSLSRIRTADDPIEAVLMGTLAQFDRLTGTLVDRSDGLASIAHDLRTTLELDAPVNEPSKYPWETGPCIMGVLNVTPDSFHDGGRYDALEDALDRAKHMVDAGAEIVDVGGESTRPGADPVSVDDEIDRVVPVIERLAGGGGSDGHSDEDQDRGVDGDEGVDALLSVDTRRAAVAEAALEAGADVVNDVSGLADPEMRFVAAEHDAPVVLMHSIDAPVVPDRDVQYDDVVEDVIEQLTERVLLAEKAGLERDQILIDPGLGFAKTPDEGFELLDRLEEFRTFGCPILIGHSHKSMFERVGRARGERLEPTIAATALAVDRGADVVRVHDVPENVAAMKTALATRGDDVSSGEP